MSTRAKVNPDGTCTRCGQIHPKCAAHNRTGNPCGKVKAKGAEVCVSHGGKAPQVKAAAAVRQQEAEAARQVATLGVKVNTTPTDALLDEVQWTAGHVQWLRRQVQELTSEPTHTATSLSGEDLGLQNTDGRDSLTWGTTKIKIGGDDRGMTQEAKPSIWYELYERERKHLVNVCSAALKAGVEERKVRLAERQGDIVVDLIRRILDGLYRALLTAGLTDEQLRDAWQNAIADVVPREIRSIQDPT